MPLQYSHVDVFAQHPFAGNSVPVITDSRGLSGRQMLAITQELRHFEAIFLEPTSDRSFVRARVFDLFQELTFAGHPIIGAAAILHRLGGRPARCDWTMELPSKTVTIRTERTDTGYFGMLDQGTPEFLGRVAAADWIARSFGLEPGDLHAQLPIEVVSTGLRYLIVPVVPGALDRARLSRNITEELHSVGAEFAVLLDESMHEVRHWNNDGVIEDVATGSAAGTIGAYRLRHGLARADEVLVLNQGRFTGRPSVLRVQAEGTREHVGRVTVGGDVAFVGHGVLDARP
jgi:PhzF family phenazine biosynthesis protein